MSGFGPLRRPLRDADLPATVARSADVALRSTVGNAAGLSQPPTYRQIVVGPVPAGQHEAYVCPPGHKALVGSMTVFNPTAGAVEVDEHIVPAGGAPAPGNMHRYLAPAANAMGTWGATPALLMPGQRLVLVASAAGLSYTVLVIEIDYDEPLWGLSATGVTNGSGDVELYECPEGATAKLFSGGWTQFLPAVSALNYTASAGVAVVKIAKDGAAAVQIARAAVAAGGVSQGLSLGELALEGGDVLTVGQTSAGASLNVYAVVQETPLAWGPLVATEGDSMTLDYPALLRPLLPRPHSLHNLAAGSETLAQMQAAAAATDALLGHVGDFTGTALVLWAGTNDLFLGTPAAEVAASIADYCADRRAAGWGAVVVVTLLPRSGNGGATPPGFEAARQAVNDAVRAGWEGWADALADVAADPRIGDAGDELDGTYYEQVGGGARLHLNAAGEAVVARAVADALLPILP